MRFGPWCIAGHVVSRNISGITQSVGEHCSASWSARLHTSACPEYMTTSFFLYAFRMLPRMLFVPQVWDTYLGSTPARPYGYLLAETLQPSRPK